MGRNERTQMPPGTSTKEKHTQLSAPRLTLIDRSSGPVTVRVVDLGEVATQLLEPRRQRPHIVVTQAAAAWRVYSSAHHHRGIRRDVPTLAHAPAAEINAPRYTPTSWVRKITMPSHIVIGMLGPHTLPPVASYKVTSCQTKTH